MAVSYRVTVYRENLARIFRSGGDADEWIFKVSSAMMKAAIKDAPNRTGTLAAAHRIEKGSRWGNRYQSRYTIQNISDHAEFVHEGTRGSRPASGFIYLPAGGPGRNTVSPYIGQSFPKIRVRGVKGQMANPWLEDACSRVSMRYGAVLVAL